MNYYIVHYDIAAIIILMTICIHFMYKRNIDTLQTKVFNVFIWFAIITSILDLATLVVFMSDSMTIWEKDIINMLYLFGFNCTPIIYYAYIMTVTKTRIKKITVRQVIKLIPLMFSLINILLSGITGLVFYFDENNVYTHGPLMIILYIIAAYYIFSAVWHTIKHRNILSKRQTTSIYFFTILMMSALILQNIYNNLLILHFAFAISMLLIYLSLENPEDYADKKLGILNSLAFSEILDNNIDEGNKFQLMVIKVAGMDFVNETLGKSSSDLLLNQISYFLDGVSSKKYLFFIADNEFAIIADEKDEEWEKIENDIYDRFRKPFKVEGGEIPLTPYICMIKYPENVKNKDSMLQMIEYSIRKAKTLGEEITAYADESIIEQAKRESQIIQILKRALIDKTFEVYYQPIYSVEKKRFTSAEALIRLNSKELGFISPEEFIPLAEKNGMILEIGEYVFSEVCEFISTEKLWEKGIEYIDVNLSVVQCMQEKLYETLIGIMDKYNLEYHYINLEITETAAVISSDTLKNNMKKLMNKGIKFSLDDYGTGYSNTANLIKYVFHTIKLDKSMVWSAMENKKAMCALKHTIAMVKDMNMELVAEGVEDEEQVKTLTQLGCDFFQGYFYSKPVQREEFYKRISEQEEKI